MDNLRNAVCRWILLLALFALTYFIASQALSVLIYGPNGWPLLDLGNTNYLSNLSHSVSFLYEEAWRYLSWTLAHRRVPSITANNFYVAKVLGVPLIALACFGIGFAAFYDRWSEWKVFKSKEKIHGDAKWASESDIKKAQLRSKKGLLVGRDSSGFLVAPGYQHALLFAPTGSGKGVGFVIPNLLFWEDSCLVHDMKLECHEKTSGWRQSIGHKCYVWAPSDPDGNTHCYNPLDWISTKPGQMVDDVQKIANFILPNQGGSQDFWNAEGRSLFVGIVLFLLASPDRITSFGEVVRVLREDDVTYTIAVVLDTLGKNIHPVGYMNLASFLQKADKERSGVVSTLNSALELWANPLIDTATATSDFNLQMMKREKITVYVGITPDNLKRLEKLLQIFYQQATDVMTRKIPNPQEEPYGVLFLMDEFPSIGRMDTFKSGIAFYRGYNVRLFLVVQDTQQLKATYEEAGMNSFLSNSTYRITFAANNVETANLISQMCGNKTVESVSQSKPKFLDFNPASRSMNVSETQRALLLPQEVLMLPKDEQILLIEAFPPIKSKKIVYYEDSFFKSRLLPPTSIPRQSPYNPVRASVSNVEDESTVEGDLAGALMELESDNSLDRDLESALMELEEDKKSQDVAKPEDGSPTSHL